MALRRLRVPSPMWCLDLTAPQGSHGGPCASAWGHPHPGRSPIASSASCNLSTTAPPAFPHPHGVGTYRKPAVLSLAVNTAPGRWPLDSSLPAGQENHHRGPAKPRLPSPAVPTWGTQRIWLVPSGGPAGAGHHLVTVGRCVF